MWQNNRKTFIDQRLDEVMFCALDFETTQIQGSPGELAIIEIGAHKFSQNGIVDQPFQSLISPSCKIRPFDSRVSGITDNMVRGQPLFSEIYQEFFSYVDGSVLVAHNAPFDKRALLSQCARDGIELPDLIFIDTLPLLKRVVALPKYSLDFVLSHFKISNKVHHRAGDDSLAVLKLFVIILSILREKHGVVNLYQVLGMLDSNMPSKDQQLSLF